MADAEQRLSNTAPAAADGTVAARSGGAVAAAGAVAVAAAAAPPAARDGELRASAKVYPLPARTRGQTAILHYHALLV